MSKQLLGVVDNAAAEKLPIITSVEAFHKEADLLLSFLVYAANKKVLVNFAPIKTTDKRLDYHKNKLLNDKPLEEKAARI